MITVVKQIMDGSKTLFSAKSNNDFVKQCKKAFDLFIATEYNDNASILGQIKEIFKKNNIPTDRLEICHNPDGSMVVFYGRSDDGKHKNFFHVNTCTFGSYQVESKDSPCDYMVMFDYISPKNKKNIYIGMHITGVNKGDDDIEFVSYKVFNYNGIGSPIYIANKCQDYIKKNDDEGFKEFLKNGTKQFGTDNKQAKGTK